MFTKSSNVKALTSQKFMTPLKEIITLWNFVVKWKVIKNRTLFSLNEYHWKSRKHSFKIRTSEKLHKLQSFEKNLIVEKIFFLKLLSLNKASSFFSLFCFQHQSLEILFNHLLFTDFSFLISFPQWTIHENPNLMQKKANYWQGKKMYVARISVLYSDVVCLFLVAMEGFSARVERLMVYWNRSLWFWDFADCCVIAKQ